MRQDIWYLDAGVKKLNLSYLSVPTGHITLNSCSIHSIATQLMLNPHGFYIVFAVKYMFLSFLYTGDRNCMNGRLIDCLIPDIDTITSDMTQL